MLYGINNLGKSTQARLLIQRLKEAGKTSEYIKYPLYAEDPSGIILNDYLRKGNPWGLTPREAQIFYTFNRGQYASRLEELLGRVDFVVAEDYWGTGVSWGTGAGVDFNFLMSINKFCLREDLALIFRGSRFVESIEQGHTHESNSELVERVRQVHEHLAAEYGWKHVDANASIEQVSDQAWSHIKLVL